MHTNKNANARGAKEKKISRKDGFGPTGGTIGECEQRRERGSIPLGASPYQASAVPDPPVCQGEARNVANYFERNQSPVVRLSFGTTI
jgi:hypothetical protein